jgi:hypothetical protein
MTGKEYKIFCNCKTPNVVYLIDCHVCRSQYAGESVQPFNKIINGQQRLSPHTYHPSLEKISGIFRYHWKEIEKSEALAKLFPEPPVVAFRRPMDTEVTLRKRRSCP